MTLQDAMNSTVDFLTPQQVAEILGCDPQGIRELAKRGELPYPAHRTGKKGTRWKIPRVAFLKYMMGGLI